MHKVFLDLKKGPKHWYSEVKQARITPWEVALGFSVGIFISMIALPIINIVLVLLAIAILRANKLAVMLGYIILLWPTTPLVYYASLRIGLFIFRINETIPAMSDISAQLIRKYLVIFAVGNILASAATATLCFLVIYSVGRLIEIVKKNKNNPPPIDKTI